MEVFKMGQSENVEPIIEPQQESLVTSDPDSAILNSDDGPRDNWSDNDEDLIEAAFGLLCNVDGCQGGTQQTAEWVDAWSRWKDRYNARADRRYARSESQSGLEQDPSRYASIEDGTPPAVQPLSELVPCRYDKRVLGCRPCTDIARRTS